MICCAFASSHELDRPCFFLLFKLCSHFCVDISQTGEICLDILKTAWSPAWTLQSVCRAVIALLAHPEADSPLNCDAGV